MLLFDVLFYTDPMHLYFLFCFWNLVVLAVNSASSEEMIYMTYEYASHFIYATNLVTKLLHTG